MTELKIGGRVIPLLYTTKELIDIQNELGCTGHQIRDEVFGIRQTDEDDPTSIVFDCVTDGKKTEKLGTLIRILGNAGLEENGEQPDLTDKWILRHMKPGLILAFALVVMAEINIGNRVELTEDDKEKGPVDETLEEQLAKKPQGS